VKNRKLFNILFLPLNSNLKQSFLADLPLFEPLAANMKVVFLRTYNRQIPEGKTGNIFFFKTWSHFNIPLRLYFFVKKQQPHVIFIHSFIFPVQVLLLRFFITTSTRIIVQHHAENPFKNPVRRWLQKQAYSRSNACLFTSKDLARPFLEHGIINLSHKVHEVPESSSVFITGDKGKARKYLNIGNEKVFLWVGRLDTNKDPLTVLEGFKRYNQQQPGSKLFMIFTTRDLLPGISAFINVNNMKLNIILIGEVNHREMEVWYRAADYFISASHYESTGYALCEAMACGCIPIVSDIPSYRKMTNQGDCGILFEAGNAGDLDSKLCSLKDLDAGTMREKVLGQFKKELSFEAIGKKLEAIAISLLQK
jgi:glycosyltransferase involved in cell wall biosynthesis